jgi:hypothetical protein
MCNVILQDDLNASGEQQRRDLPPVVRSKEMTPEEWMENFDSQTGRIIDVQQLKKKLFYGVCC